MDVEILAGVGTASRHTVADDDRLKRKEMRARITEGRFHLSGSLSAARSKNNAIAVGHPDPRGPRPCPIESVARDRDCIWRTDTATRPLLEEHRASGSTGTGDESTGRRRSRSELLATPAEGNKAIVGSLRLKAKD